MTKARPSLRIGRFECIVRFCGGGSPESLKEELKKHFPKGQILLLDDSIRGREAFCLVGDWKDINKIRVFLKTFCRKNNLNFAG